MTMNASAKSFLNISYNQHISYTAEVIWFLRVEALIFIIDNNI